MRWRLSGSKTRYYLNLLYQYVTVEGIVLWISANHMYGCRIGFHMEKLMPWAYCTMQNIYIFLNARGAFTVAHVPARTMKSEKKGILLPVREAQCRYRSPAHYDDLIWVQIAISDWKRASVRFAYRMYNEDRSLLLARGDDRTCRI